MRINNYFSWSALAYSFAALAIGALVGLQQWIVVAVLLAVMTLPLVGRYEEFFVSVFLSLGGVVVGLLPLLAEGPGAKMGWAVSALGFALLAHFLLQAMWRQGGVKYDKLPVGLLLGFLIYSIVVSIGRGNLYELISGLKREFQAAFLVVAGAMFIRPPTQLKKYKRIFFVVALLQVPACLYQLIVLFPMRISVQQLYPGMVPIDVVSGTYGASMFGGGANAEMATCLLVLSGIIAASGFGGRWRALVLFLILLPIFLGETKVMVILIPLYFAILYRRELVRKPVFALALTAAMVVLTVGAGMVYMHFKKKDVTGLIEETLSYNLYERGYGGLELNRTSVLTYWYKKHDVSNFGHALIGHGLGSAHEATGGSEAVKSPGYGIGLTAASTLLWEVGVVGLLLYLGFLWACWRTIGIAIARFAAGNASKWMIGELRGIQAAVPIIAAYLIYRNALLENMPFQIFVYGILGYAFWLINQTRPEVDRV